MSFPAGTLIRMANGSDKSIEQIDAGERIYGAWGRPCSVVGIEAEPLHTKSTADVSGMMRNVFDINGELMVTGTHLMMTAAGWAVIEHDRYTNHVRLGGSEPLHNGRGRSRQMIRNIAIKPADVRPFGPTRPLPLVHLAGLRKLHRIRMLDPSALAPEETYYSLKTDGSHTMHVNGYLVSAWATDEDYDYKNRRQKSGGRE